MRIRNGASIGNVLLLFSLVFLSDPAWADLAPTVSAPFFTEIAGFGGTGWDYALAETVREAEPSFFSTPVARRYLAAVTSGFRKTKVHARRLSAECRFPGIVRVAGVGRFEGGMALAALPLTEGLQREKTPQETRSPPSFSQGGCPQV